MHTLASLSLAALALVSGYQLAPGAAQEAAAPLQLGAFSVSLSVADIQASKAFYEKLDFKKVGGDIEQKWLVLQNGTTTIGLFQGMFPKNMLTFNPGWSPSKEALKEFQDVRALQRTLKSRGIAPVTEADEDSAGVAHFVLVDPDGNPILFDQHVPKPALAPAAKPGSDGGER